MDNFILVAFVGVIIGTIVSQVKCGKILPGLFYAWFVLACLVYYQYAMRFLLEATFEFTGGIILLMWLFLSYVGIPFLIVGFPYFVSNWKKS